MAFENSILGDVIEWFLAKIGGDRRQYKRRAGAFHLWWQRDARDSSSSKPGIGVELSPNGLVFIIPNAIPEREFSLVLDVRGKRMPVRVRAVRSDVVDRQGKPWNRYMVEFQGIAADDWDAIVRYVEDTPDPPDKATLPNPEATQSDDAYRLLPMVVQDKIVRMLVQMKKLERPHPGQTPLLKLSYGGIIRRAGQPNAHRFNVHSRVLKDGEATAHDTRFIVSDEGEVSLG